MYRSTQKRENPWKREPATPDLSPCQLRYVRELSSTWPKFSNFDCNEYLDSDTNATVLNASPSVVALISFSVGVQLTRGSGTIIEKHDDAIIVLTSANLIRRPTSEEFGENTLADDVTVHAHLCGGDFYREGEVYAYDFHYNIAVIRFSFIPPFGPAKVAKVAHIDDSIDVHSSRASHPPFRLLPHSASYKLTPGNRVIVMGRYFAEPFEPMAAPGEYRLEKTSYDCKELFMTNCKITRCGDGGPLLNSLGELIGIAFFNSVSTPCLPINIACKWWDHYKKHGKRFRPFLGFEATHLFAADLGLIDRVIHNFPDARRGLVVEKVIPDSSADLAGLRVDDVIIECDDKPVQSFLELFEMLWEKVGVPTKLILVRAGDVTHKLLEMVFVEGTSDQLNSWPVHDMD
ncbi:Protease Do-like 14-like protein [Heracleum sosnowskyi]|uniref:Protease Do-like 14-like protein n=1 Tax=Heracleum sosnowskyi TaxID=360622 RepID=A0AAD8MPB4_9APIA|nr:Protease Do-like 14-like protein [Heracleum sosnowskyi]